MNSKKFGIDKKVDNSLSSRDIGDISKRNILYTNESSIDNNTNKEGNSVRKLSSNGDHAFYRKIEKMANKKGQMSTQNKSNRKTINYSGNNSYLHFQKNFGNKFNNYNTNEKTFTTKGNNLSKSKENNINSNVDILKIKYNHNKNLIIECAYCNSNKDNYNTSGEKYIKNKNGYIYSLPNSSKKMINTTNNTNNTSSYKKEKNMVNIAPNKRNYEGINTSLLTKYKKKIKPYVRSSLYKNNDKNDNIYKKISKINSKRSKDFSSSNFIHPSTIRRGANMSNLEKNFSNYRYNSEIISFDVEANKDKDKTYTKINLVGGVIDNKKKDKNFIKSIKVNKNNCYEKDSKTSLNSININGISNNIAHYYMNKNNTNINTNAFINNSKKIFKTKERLQSCKFSDEQIYELEKEIMQNKEKIKYKPKFIERANNNSTKERKNIVFFSNYMKNKNVCNNNVNNVNMKHKHYFTNSNISSNINNNSEIIRKTNNNTNTSNVNTKNINSSNKKRKSSLLYKNHLIKDVDIQSKLKIKIKSKPLTTLQSKDNSRSNLFSESLINNNSTKNAKQKQFDKNSNINNKIIHNTKKIFINNIINLNTSNDNNISNNNKSNNIINNYSSYRYVGNEKIYSYKHQIINVPSSNPYLDYSHANKSQKHISHNQINLSKPPIKEVLSNKNNIKMKENNSTNKNIFKKNNLINIHNTSNKKIRISKDPIDKEANSNNYKKISSGNYILNSKNQTNILKEINSEIISKNKIMENNPSLVSTLKECTFYKQEMEKLSSYIKSYYQKHKTYPNTNKNFYKYGRLLGKGAFGKVNLALHLASGRLVAIKSFNKKKLAVKRAKRKVKTEIDVLSKLRNPFCTQIYDYFETDTHVLIVMEYVCGDLLGYIRKRGKISESTSKIIFKQIIKGLQLIHKKKIVHRDIKLDNVLIDLTNTVKICDFGVSRILQPGDVMYEHCGTPAYIAPEIFKDNGYEGFSCDIWSAGVTLYYMIAGTQPFKANKIEDLKEIILKGKYEPIQDASEEVNDLINGMLQLNPEKRLTIEEILKHPWLKKVNIKNREKLNIFTNAEKGLLSKYDVNYLSSPKEELIEVFTISNLETKEEKEEKGGTKSDILAPYNSYAIEPEKDIYKEIKIENDICRFNFKAQLSNIKYELSNNLEFDNGIIKTIYNSCEEGNKKTHNEFENVNSLNLSLDSIETFTCGLCDDIIKDVEEYIGYEKKYLVQCLRKNEINYATATYYLMLRDEMNYNY